MNHKNNTACNIHGMIGKISVDIIEQTALLKNIFIRKFNNIEPMERKDNSVIYIDGITT